MQQWSCFITTKFQVKYTELIGDESVPKIIINDTNNNFFLKLQSAFW